MAKKTKAGSRHPKLGDRRFKESLEQASGLMTRRRYAEAHELLQGLDREYPQKPDILYLLLEVAGYLDDAHTVQYACERLHVLHINDPDIPFLLTIACLKNGWGALALSTGRRAVAQHPAHPQAKNVREMLASLAPAVDEEIESLGLNGPDGLGCFTLHDRIRSLASQGRFAKAREVAGELIQRRPRFAPGYNNGADASFHDAAIGQAIVLTQRLLSFDPENVFARCNLVRYLCAVGKMDEARALAEQLKDMSPMGLDLVIKRAEALAWLGDDEGVLKVFTQLRKEDEALDPRENALLFHLAAVAACRLGREEEARDYWQKAVRAVPRFAMAQSNLDDLKKPLRERNAPWSFTFNHFVPKKLIDQLVKKLKPAPGKRPEEMVQSQAKEYLAEHPELEGLVPLLLDRSDGHGRELALHLVSLYRTPAMLQVARDFALGKRGADSLRMRAMSLASEAGLLADDTHKFWLDGEPHAATMRLFEIHSDVVKRTHAPGVFDLLSQGVSELQRGNPARAETVLRQALAIDPDDPLVMNNLAVVCAELGRRAEAEALSERIFEKHPDYLFGRTALANLAVGRGDYARAHELLDPLLTRSRLHFGEFSTMCTAFITLYQAEGKLKEAQNMLAMWREAVPDHPGIEAFERQLRSKTEY